MGLEIGRTDEWKGRPWAQSLRVSSVGDVLRDVPEATVYSPVSYTHLDVYKRQGKDRQPVMKKHWDVTPDDAKTMTEQAVWCPANREYFRGGGYSVHYVTRGGAPVTKMCIRDRGYSYYQVIRQTGNAVKNRVLPRQAAPYILSLIHI